MRLAPWRDDILCALDWLDDFRIILRLVRTPRLEGVVLSSWLIANFRPVPRCARLSMGDMSTRLSPRMTGFHLPPFSEIAGGRSQEDVELVRDILQSSRNGHGQPHQQQLRQLQPRHASAQAEYHLSASDGIIGTDYTRSREQHPSQAPLHAESTTHGFLQSIETAVTGQICRLIRFRLL